MQAHKLAMPDFHDFFNAISPSPTMQSGHVTFDVCWSGGGARSHINDPVFGFAGDYTAGPIRIDFTASDDGAGVTYHSLPDGQITVSGGVGHERNGIFYRADPDAARRKRAARAARRSRWAS